MIPIGPRAHRAAQGKEPGCKRQLKEGRLCGALDTRSRKIISPHEGREETGAQLSARNGRLRPRLLTNGATSPAGGCFGVSECQARGFLSWLRLYRSASQSVRGNLVAWPIRVSLARLCQSNLETDLDNFNPKLANQKGTGVPASGGKLRLFSLSPPSNLQTNQ